jgi:beta-mannosidase
MSGNFRWYAEYFSRNMFWFVLILTVTLPLVAQTAVQHLSLNGDWQFRQSETDPIAVDRVGVHEGTTDWHKAAVPGVVQTDLLANKLIPDPFYRDNESKLQWIGFANWEYQRTFNVSQLQFRQQHAELVFDGLDTFAKVFVNGKQVLAADNMFRTWRVEVGPQLQAGQNTIRVEFSSPLLSALQHVKAEKYPLPGSADSPWAKPFGVSTSNYVRKAPYNYGWDWGPRFLTAGIWRPVEIEFWNTARIDNVYVRQLDVSKASANITVETDVIAGAAKRVQVALNESPWTGTNDAGTRNAKATHHAAASIQTQFVWLHPGANHVIFALNINHPALWYPTGYGAQNMYRFRVALRDGTSQVDSKEAHAGLRSVELRRDPDQWGRSFEFVVNGIPIFAKGANLIPFDSFPTRTTDADMRRILDSARDANMNMLRVWGGGYYGTDRFYELADERGLMLWQEFMFSDAMYPHDKAFLDNVQEEAVDQVRRLRNHPSIVLWCGNNEVETAAWHSWKGFDAAVKDMSPKRRDEEWGGYMHLFSGILPQVVAEYSPATPYWPSSPSNNFAAAPDDDQYGDAHYWEVWHGTAPFSAFEDQYPRFMSEYGFQSFPSMATIDTFTEPQDRTLLSPVMLAHQKNTRGNQLIKLYMEREFPQPKDFPSFVYVSQVLQAQGIQLGTEHLRRNRPHVMGALYWQLNDCWPVASWASVDYYGRWKALQYYAKRFYQDVLVSPHVRDGKIEISIVSDRTQAINGTLRVQLMDFSGKILSQKDAPVEIQPLSAAQVWEAPQIDYLKTANGGAADPAAVFLHVELRLSEDKTGQPVSTNNLYFLPYKDLHLPPATIRSEWTVIDGKPALRLSSVVLARDVDIETGAFDGRPSDNFFDLLPGQSKTVVFAKGTKEDLKKTLSIVSLTDAFTSSR